MTMTGGSAERVDARMPSTLPLKNRAKWSADNFSEGHCFGDWSNMTTARQRALVLRPQELTVDSQNSVNFVWYS